MRVIAGGASSGAGTKGKRSGLKDPAPVQSILKMALSRYGLDRDLARYEFVLHWKEIVGEEIAKRTRPECLKNGLLVVRVSDSSWAQELSFQRETILQRLRKFLSSDEVLKDVYFYVAGGK